MCGICGIRRFGDTPINQAIFDILLVENQRRGNHATGVAIQQSDGEINVLKKDVPAWTLTGSLEYKAFMNRFLRDDSITILGHTRLATQGSPTKNENNHPMWDGTTAVIHNGIIINDDDMFKELKLKRAAETDSDIIRAIFDNYGFSAKAVNQLSRLNGSAAIAAISVDFPGKLFLGRSGNPIELASMDDILLWSSEAGPIRKAARPIRKKFGIHFRQIHRDLGMIPMNNDSAYIIGAKPKSGQGVDGDWLEYHQSLRIATNFTPHCYEVNKSYHTGCRIRYHDFKRANIVQCPNRKCMSWIPVNQLQAATMKNWKCTKCGTRLFDERK